MEKSTIVNKILHIFPIKKRKIMFMSTFGYNYDCNPKYLSEYMVKHCPEWDIVWAFVNPDKHEVKGVRKVNFASARYFYELATCRIFVTNKRMFNHFQKRKGQFYIQTWHSSLRLKMIEKDAEKHLSTSYIEKAKRDSQQMDLLISGCQKSTDIFKKSFWYSGSIISSGTPREDYLLNANPSEISRIKQKLGIDKKKRIILYAPTFRKDHSTDIYNLDFSAIKRELQKKTGEDWLILMRLHPNMSYLSQKLKQNSSDFINVSTYDDIQELLLISDIVISDYSSLIFDFAFTKRPCFLYVPDLDEYTKNDRGFYFNISELPFPIAKTNEELIELINSHIDSSYKSKVEDFLKSIGTFETGHACENIVNYINKTVK